MSIGIGVGVSGSLIGHLAAYPQCTVAPVVSGTVGVGNVLSVTNGTWTNTPTSYHYQWYDANGLTYSPIGTDSSSYTQAVTDVGDNIFCAVEAVNANGAGYASSNLIGPVTGAGINAPTLALHTASGVSPASWDITGDSTFVPGMYVHQQFATNSGFTTGVTDYYTQIEGSDWEATNASIGNALVTFVQPASGVQYWQRARFETLPNDPTNNVVSPWSNTQTDTPTGSTAVIQHATGTGDSRYLTVSTPFYEGVMNNNIGALCLARATIAAQNTKFHCEFKCKFFAGSGGNSGAYFGFDDASINLDSSGFIASSSAPGTSGVNGLTVKVTKGSTSAQIAINGTAFATLTLPSAATDGVSFAFDIDNSVTNPTILITYFDGTTATTLNGHAAFTMSGSKPATFNALIGGSQGNGTASSGNSDVVDFNPSSTVTAWLVTPQTGFQQYG